MSNKIFYSVLTVLVMVGFSFLVLRSPNSESTVDDGVKTKTLQADASDRYLNKPSVSKATLIEYSDFECPACAAVWPLMQEVKAEFADDLTIVFRHFPLTAIHPRAMTAHRIAEAAHAQGRFTEVHDLLFELNDTWTSAESPDSVIFDLIETSTDIDMQKLQQDAEANQTNQTIQKQLQVGKAFGVQATPTLFLNGQKIDLVSVEQLRSEIQDAIDAYEASNE